MVWCALDGETDMGKALMLALVPADTPGLTTDGKWDTLGMRGTYSPSVTFSGARIPKDAALGRPGAVTQVGVVESFGLGYAAVYVGIAEAALEFALNYAKERVVKPENIAIAQDPTVQRHLGGLAVHLDAARLVLADAAARWELGRGGRARQSRQPREVSGHRGEPGGNVQGDPGGGGAGRLP
jgi:alkylation response protein AidB-like acyl-CoA dehydrogenase